MKDEQSSWLELPEKGWHPVALPHAAIKDNFVSGDASGRRLRIRYFRREDSGALMAKALFGAGTQGPPGHAHGGSIASLLDEAMGGAAWMAGHAAVAIELTIRFKKMLPLETSCVAEASVSRIAGRKVWTRAELRNREGDVVFAESEAMFLELDRKQFGELAERASELIGRGVAAKGER